MKHVAITSAVGGAGRTTLTALLSQALARAGHDVIALDMDPANLLGLALGGNERPAQGIGSLAPQERGWSETAMVTPEGVRYIPFGACSMREIEALATRLMQQADWLPRRLAQIDLPAETWVLCDTPRQPSPYAEHVVAMADIRVEVVVPDLYAYATSHDHTDRWIVINGFDARQRLQADVRTLLAADHGSRLCPVPIHRDQALPEAMAREHSVLEEAPQSRITQDIENVARWLVELGHE